jgi:hypothetical protein
MRFVPLLQPTFSLKIASSQCIAIEIFLMNVLLAGRMGIPVTVVLVLICSITPGSLIWTCSKKLLQNNRRQYLRAIESNVSFVDSVWSWSLALILTRGLETAAHSIADSRGIVTYRLQSICVVRPHPSAMLREILDAARLNWSFSLEFPGGICFMSNRVDSQKSIDSW